ncbi:unnamed protein product [Cunninghamella blakesleeana]
MENSFNQKLLDLYEKLGIYVRSLAGTNGKVDNDLINSYSSLRIEYSEFIDFFQPTNDKEKRLLRLLERFMRFTRFTVYLFKEEDLDNLSKHLFSQIFGVGFNKESILNGFICLKTYLWANEVIRLRKINGIRSVDEKTIKDTLTTYFPTEKLIYMNDPFFDDAICRSMGERKESLRKGYFKTDPKRTRNFLLTVGRGKILRKGWIPAINTCLNVFDELLDKIKNSPSIITEEITSTAQITDVNFEIDSIPNNQQQLNSKKKNKHLQLDNINKSRMIQEESSSSSFSLPSPPPSSPPSSSSPPQLSTTVSSPKYGKRSKRTSLQSSSKRNASEAELSDEELHESRDPTYTEQTVDEEFSGEDQSESEELSNESDDFTNGTSRSSKKKGWSKENLKSSGLPLK